MKKIVTLLALVAATTTHAAILVDFEGGGGAPLTFDVEAATFVITDATTFNFGSSFGIGIAVGQVAADSLYFSSAGGDASLWSSDGATAFTGVKSPVAFFANNDLPAAGANSGGIMWQSIFSNQSAVNGEKFTFQGGSFGTTGAITESYVDGAYDVFIISASSGAPLSAAAVAVPEPQSYAAIAGLLVLAGLAYRRMRA